VVYITDINTVDSMHRIVRPLLLRNGGSAVTVPTCNSNPKADRLSTAKRRLRRTKTTASPATRMPRPQGPSLRRIRRSAQMSDALRSARRCTPAGRTATRWTSAGALVSPASPRPSGRSAAVRAGRRADSAANCCTSAAEARGFEYESAHVLGARVGHAHEEPPEAISELF
jgi:hypothetical protein